MDPENPAPGQTSDRSTPRPPPIRVPASHRRKPSVIKTPADPDADAESDYSSVSTDDLPPIYAFGHSYHGSGAILTPNDDSERKRLEVQHELFKLCLDGRLTTSKIESELVPMKIMDVGAGSGVWAVEMGDACPLAHIMGVDVSAALLPTNVPKNVIFEIGDASDPWTSDAGSLDFVHMRDLGGGGGIKDWAALLEKALECLKPGGKIEVSDYRISWREFHERGKRPESSRSTEGQRPSPRLAACREFETAFARAAEMLGFDVRPTDRIPGILAELGFERVVESKEYVPVKPWGTDEKMLRKGSAGEELVSLSLENCAMMPLAKCGWAEEDIRDLLRRVYVEIQDPALYGYGTAVFITATKPLRR